MSIFINKASFLPFGVYSVISPLAATGIPYAATIDRTINFKSWSQSVYLIGPNNVTNFWTVRLMRLRDAGLIASFSTAALPITTWSLTTITAFSIPSIDESFRGAFIQCVANGAPGGIYVAGPLVEI